MTLNELANELRKSIEDMYAVIIRLEGSSGCVNLYLEFPDGHKELIGIDSTLEEKLNEAIRIMRRDAVFYYGGGGWKI